MAADLKHCGRRKEWTREGVSVVYSFEGTEAEIDAMLAGHSIGEGSDDGTLVTKSKGQVGGSIWGAELRYEVSGDGGGSATPPSNAWGSKSATLRGSMLSVPLQNHPRYKAKWDHYLAAAPGVTTLPVWWESADSLLISGNDEQKYRWVANIDDRPTTGGRQWQILKEPTKPGRSSYDVATYSITETARYKTAAAAGSAVAGKLNHIGAPSEKFGITGGNWKCDDAGVLFDGKRWLGTTTWTRSGDDRGWDTELYD